MKPPPFLYFEPRSVQEATALLAQRGSDAKVLAGGQSLMPMMNLRLARPDVLVDINRISELSSIGVDNGQLVVGALVRQIELEESETARTVVPLLAETMRWVGHRATRNRGTLGGTVAHADPAAEVPAVLVALSAEVVARSEGGDRVIEAEDFFVGPLMTSLRPEELLTEVRVPRQPPHVRVAVREIARRQGDFAVAGVVGAAASGAEARIDSIRLAVFGAGPVPLRLRRVEGLLVGNRPEEDHLDAAAEESAAAVEPRDDLHGTAEYRRKVVGVLVRRVLDAVVGVEA